MSLFSFCCPSLLAAIIPSCSNCNFLETKCLKSYQYLTSALGLFAFFHSDSYSVTLLDLFFFVSKNGFVCFFLQFPK